ncbi:MAG: hypothetical protein JJ992_28215, partial [Planctomycetes bacterium]|nr:hypothetical protein [Planctomycetota bacterium]
MSDLQFRISGFSWLVSLLLLGHLLQAAEDERWSRQEPEIQTAITRGPGTAATPRPNTFNVLPGFQVELLYTVPRERQGSWVSICFDDVGRLIASDQGQAGLYRITPPPIGSEDETKVEKLDVKLS